MINRNPLQTSHKKHALAYIRISSQRQINGESPETQQQAISNFAANNDIDIIKTFYDEAKSGKNTDRPALKELIRYADKHKDDIDHVIVYKMNRASRDMTSYITGFLLPLKRLGISKPNQLTTAFTDSLWRCLTYSSVRWTTKQNVPLP